MACLVDQDFEEMKNYLKRRAIIDDEWLDRNQSNLILLHNLVMTFLIWDHNFRKKDDNQRYFIGEVRSDCINGILAVLTGSKKSVNLILRGMVESTLNHFYYFDHPIEYEMLQSGNSNDDYLTFKELTNYIRKHPLMAICLKDTQVLERLDKCYKATSKFVHAQSPKFMQLSKALSEVSFDPIFFEWYVKKFQEVTSDLNVLLVLFHYEDFRAMQRDYRKLIMSQLTKENKVILAKI
jgi:hypothetical protein